MLVDHFRSITKIVSLIFTLSVYFVKLLCCFIKPNILKSSWPWAGFERQQASSESDSMNGLGVLTAKLAKNNWIWNGNWEPHHHHQITNTEHHITNNSHFTRQARNCGPVDPPCRPYPNQAFISMLIIRKCTLKRAPLVFVAQTAAHAFVVFMVCWSVMREQREKEEKKKTGKAMSTRSDER